MRIHPVTRQIVHGIGGEGAYRDGAPLAAGGGQNGMPDWLDDAPIWCGVTGKPFAFVRGSQVGAWAGWTSQGGVVTSWGLNLPAAVLLDMAPDGTLLVGDDYQSGIGISAYRVSSRAPHWHVPAARPEMRFPYAQAAILDAQTASWTENQNGRMVLMGFGLPAGPRPPWNVLHHRKFRVNGEVWVVYLRGEDDRTIAHPWNYRGLGFSQPGFGYGPDASFDGDTLTIYWSEAAGELPGDIQQMPCDLSKIEDIPSLPAVTPIAPKVPSLPIFGFWSANAAAPGNAALGYVKCLIPPHPCIVAWTETIADVPTERLGGMFVYLDGKDDDASIKAKIEQASVLALQYRVPMWIYDDLTYRFALIKSLCRVSWIALVRCYLSPGEDPVVFARECVAELKSFGGHPFLTVTRMYTGWRLTPEEEANKVDPDVAVGYHSVPATQVILSHNALVQAGAFEVDGNQGNFPFVWDRPDGAAGVRSREALAPLVEVWADVPTTAVNGRAFADQFFTPTVEIPPMRDLTTAERATVDAFFANFPLPHFPESQGDAPESWQDEHLRHAPDGRVYMLAQQMAFSHDKNWGQKRRDPNARISNGTIALLDPASGDKRYFHAYDLLQGASTGRPKLLGGSGTYYYVDDGQEFVPVPPLDHLGSAKPRTGRAPWPEAVKHGVSAFDVAPRLHGGDSTYYDLTAPLPLNCFVYTTIDSPQTHRIGRTFAEGLVQTETLLKRLTVDNRQAMFIMICGPHTVNNGPKPTRAEIIDMVKQQVALFERYPKAVLALSLGNELYQGFEPPELLEPAFWAEVDAIVPLQFPFAIGQVGDVVVFGPGSVAMMHPDRGKSSADALQILADAQRRAGLVVVAREPARIEAGGSGQSRGDISFVREELDNAKRLDLPYFLHNAAGRGAYVPAMDGLQHEALAMVKAEAGTVVVPPVVPPVTPPTAPGDLTTLGEEARASAIKIAYETLLGRKPDPIGVSIYTERLKSGWTVPQMEDDIRASAEYKAKHGG